MTPNFETKNFISWAKGEGRKLAMELAAKMAYAETERKRVDAYIHPIFLSYTFPVKKEWAERVGEVVKEERQLYLCDDEALCARYYAECDAAHAAHGYKASQPGECPALVAENAVIDAENALIKSIGLCLNVDFAGTLHRIADRKELIKIAMGAGLQGVRFDRARRAFISSN